MNSATFRMTKGRIWGRWTAAVLVTVLSLLVAAAQPADADADPVGSAAATSGGGRFFDDDGNIHESSIEAFAAAGITKGCNPPYNTGFCPNEPVTRGQMAAFLERALGLDEIDPGIEFVDDDGSIFESAIAKLATAGITKGCNPPTNDHFCPDDYVTRGQMAAFLVRAMGYTEGEGSVVFDDVEGSLFESAVEKLAAAGVTKGCNPPNNTDFCPDDLVTRGQMATFIARALELSSPAVPERPIDSNGTYLNVFSDAGTHGCDHSPGEVCRLSYHVSGEFYIATGWYTEDWSSIPPAGQASFKSDSLRVEAYFDGMPLDLYYWGFEVVDDVADKWWSFVFPDWLSGSHQLEVMLIDEDYGYVWTADVSLTGDGPGYGASAAMATEVTGGSSEPSRLRTGGATR